MNTTLRYMCMSVLALATMFVATAFANDLVDGAKVIGGMGPMEIMALVTLASIAALVVVVRLFVGRFLKSLDALISELKSRPCIYSRPQVKQPEGDA